MNARNRRICPVEAAGGLDNPVRRWLQDPRRILRPWVEEGMTVLDVGCGPGFFTVELARMVGDRGRVIACDLQQEMLAKVGDKIRGTALADRITLHRCAVDGLGITAPVDFALLFYLVHEIPDPTALFTELAEILGTDGRALVVEPPVHVSRAAFDATLRAAESVGLAVVARPKLFPNKTALLTSR